VSVTKSVYNSMRSEATRGMKRTAKGESKELCTSWPDVMLTWCLALAELALGEIFDPGLEEHLGDLSDINPSMLIIKYKNDRDFMEFMWLFAVPVSWTKAEARELLKMCGNNIFQADLSDDIAWALVKLMDNAKKWDGRTVGKVRERGCTGSLLLERVGGLAGMTRVLNCTRLSGAIFEQ
jgi:hypothetical protein